MHEFSIAKELVTTLLLEAESNKVITIIRVEVEIGEVSFLQEDQLVQSFDIIKKDFPVMQDAQMVVLKKPLKVKCAACGYLGKAVYNDDRFHFMIPILRCPECDSGVQVVDGKDILIKNIEAEVED